MYKLLRIQEDDFGCEERPENWTVKSWITLLDEAGQERAFRVEDAELDRLGLNPGSLIDEKTLGALTGTKEKGESV